MARLIKFLTAKWWSDVIKYVVGCLLFVIILWLGTTSFSKNTKIENGNKAYNELQTEKRERKYADSCFNNEIKTINERINDQCVKIIVEKAVNDVQYQNIMKAIERLENKK